MMAIIKCSMNNFLIALLIIQAWWATVIVIPLYQLMHGSE